MVPTDKTAMITLTNGVAFGVSVCEGLNYSDGVPSDYGVTSSDGDKLIIPRASILYFVLRDDEVCNDTADNSAV